MVVLCQLGFLALRIGEVSQALLNLDAYRCRRIAITIEMSYCLLCAIVASFSCQLALIRYSCYNLCSWHSHDLC